MEIVEGMHGVCSLGAATESVIRVLIDPTPYPVLTVMCSVQCTSSSAATLSPMCLVLDALCVKDHQIRHIPYLIV